MPGRVSRRALAGSLLAVALTALLLLVPFPAGSGGGWRGKLLDLGHVPLFAALAAWLWLALGRRWTWPVVITLTLAAVAELAQDAVGRSGNVADFVRSALGVAAAVVLVRAWRRPRTTLRVAGHSLALVAVLAWPLADALPWLLDAWEGYQAFPTLADFGTARQELRWGRRQASLRREPDPGQPAGWSARLDLLPGPERYPSAALKPVLRDWSDYRLVACSFTVVGEPLRLVISIRGRSTHHQFEKTYGPGKHTVRVDLAEVARRARPEPLDLTDVRLFQVFTYQPARTRTIYLHRIWLE
ncbi:MAG: hypothetical protein L0Z62_38885 [Gemmataceae bacterium]|nr:hypothetical protein [Gemmataceae bacterium]